MPHGNLDERDQNNVNKGRVHLNGVEAMKRFHAEYDSYRHFLVVGGDDRPRGLAADESLWRRGSNGT